MNRRWLLLGPGLFLAVMFFVPLVRILAAAWAPGAASDWQWLVRPYARSRIGTAFVQATWSMVATMAVALPLAWFHHKRRLPWSRVQLALHAAPFVLPVFVVVFGIQAVFGRTGLAGALGVDVLGTLGPMGAVVLAHVYYNYGFAARILHATLERRPWHLEDAAATLGAPPLHARLHTTLRLLAPAVAAVCILVFLFTFSSFGVVLYLGDGQVATLETLLYEQLRGAFARPGRAAVLATAQLTVNAAVLVAYAALLRRTSRLRPVLRPVPAASRLRTVLAWLFVGLALVPASLVLLQSLRVRGAWTLDAWRSLVDAGHPLHPPGFDLGHALGLSLGYAAATMAASLVLTLLLAYGLRHLGGPLRVLADAVTAIPLGTSSLLIGFGFLLTFGATWFLEPGTGRAIIIAAHTLVAFPFTARVLLPALDQQDQGLDDAARTLGAPPWALFSRVHWPLLRPAFLVAAGFAAAMSLGDFGASLLLMNSENRGVSVWIDALGGPSSFDPVRRAQSVALAALLMLLSAGAYVAVERGEHA